jgi:hypothetical protein
VDRHSRSECPTSFFLIALRKCSLPESAAAGLRIWKARSVPSETVARALVSEEAPGAVVLASSRADQKSYGWPARRQGIFTFWLCRALEGAAADENGEVTLGRVNSYVHDRVSETADLDYGLAQDPVLFGKQEGDPVPAASQWKKKDFVQTDDGLAVGARPDELYEIRVWNKSRNRVAMQLLVDGLNTLGQTRLDQRERLGLGAAWVLEPAREDRQPFVSRARRSAPARDRRRRGCSRTSISGRAGSRPWCRSATSTSGKVTSEGAQSFFLVPTRRLRVVVRPRAMGSCP